MNEKRLGDFLWVNWCISYCNFIFVYILWF